MKDRKRELLLTATALVLAAQTAFAFPLSKPEELCASALLKTSSKAVKRYGKSAAKCVRSIAKGAVGSSDPMVCVASDPKDLLERVRVDLGLVVEDACGAASSPPYPMDCSYPCQAADAAGESSGIDDAAELAQCLQCINQGVTLMVDTASPAFRGLHGAVLDGVTLATTSESAGTAKCQAKLVKAYDKLFSTQVDELARCARGELGDPALSEPPSGCLATARAGAKYQKIAARLSKAVTNCAVSAPVASPFDAGSCALKSGDPELTFCLIHVANCRTCRWGNAILGSALDCDLYDNGLGDGTCPAVPLGTTTIPTPTSTLPVSTTTLPPPTTTLPVPTTTLPTPTTTLPAPTTTLPAPTTTLPAPTTTLPAPTTTLPAPTTTLPAPTTTLPTPTTTLPAPTTTLPTPTTTLPANLTVCDTFDTEWGSLGITHGLFDGPRGVAVSPAQEVFVVDSRNDRVQVFDAIGTFLHQFGSNGQGLGEFDRPRSGAFGASATYYVTDRTNNRIERFNTAGIALATWGALGVGDGQFDQPQGIATDAAGNVYVADGNNNRIQKFSATGTFLAKWGTLGSGDGQFNAPRGVAVDAAGNVYVADSANSRIQKFTSSGVFLGKWGVLGSGDGQLRVPRDVAVGPDGIVYVADTDNHRIQAFDANGSFLGTWGSLGIAAGRFQFPRGVAVDAAGNVYVGDTENNRVQKFRCGP